MFSIPKAFSYHVPHGEINAKKLKTCLEFVLVTFHWSPSCFKAMKNTISEICHLTYVQAQLADGLTQMNLGVHLLEH